MVSFDPGFAGTAGWDPGFAGTAGWDPGFAGTAGWDPGFAGWVPNADTAGLYPGIVVIT